MQIQRSASARNAGNLLDGKWPRSWRERGRTVNRGGAGLWCQKSLEKRKFPLWKLQNGILVAEVYSSEIDIYYTSTQSHGCFLHHSWPLRWFEDLITLSRYDGSFTCKLAKCGTCSDDEKVLPRQPYHTGITDNSLSTNTAVMGLTTQCFSLMLASCLIYSLCKPYFLTKQIPQAKTDLKQDQESRRVITDFNPLKA